MKKLKKRKTRKKAEYDIRVVVEDKHYTYAGYPHEDEGITITVYKGRRKIPIGPVVKDMKELEEDALNKKYGWRFIDKLQDAFLCYDESGSWEDACGVDEGDTSYCVVSACDRAATEYKLDSFRASGFVVEDLRSLESRLLSHEAYHLWQHCERDFKKDGINILELPEADAVRMICDRYGVSSESASCWYYNN